MMAHDRNHNDNDKSNFCKIIQLNIGGTYYATTKSTLCLQDSMLKTMFNFPLIYDEDKRIFIDRDGKHFRYILNFLRDNYIDIPSDPIIHSELLREAQYYCFDNLINFLQEEPVPIHSMKEFNYVGQWESSQREYNYKFKMELKVKEQTEENQSKVPIEGFILWTLEKVPPGSHLQDRIGDYGREFVEGTLNRDELTIEFCGVRRDVSATGLIALDHYKLQLGEDGQSFTGKTLGHEQSWKNVIEGKTEDLIRKEKIEKTIKTYHQNKEIVNHS